MITIPTTLFSGTDQRDILPAGTRETSPYDGTIFKAPRVLKWNIQGPLNLKHVKSLCRRSVKALQAVSTALPC